MSRLPKLAVLASGSGTNLQAILDEVAQGQLPVDIRIVFSDKKEAYALTRARNADIETISLSPKSFPSRDEFDSEVVRLLRERDVEWVILAGYMRILSKAFVSAFPNRILNIHPALLPAYPGTHSIQRAFEAGEKQVGVTVHFVDEGVDTGSIVLQESIPVEKGETLEALTERIHRLEHQLFPEAIRKVIAR